VTGQGISRRTALVAGAAATLVPAVVRAAATEAAGPGLNVLARAKGMRFGSAYAWSPQNADRGSFANPAYARLLRRDCGLLVPENELKWQHIRPGPDQFDFAHFDAMLDWAEHEHIAVRGHNLLWHRTKWLPGWVNSHDFGSRPAAEAERLITTHVRTVLRRYGTRIGNYDVVNETVNDHDGTLEQTALSRALGSTEAVVDLAFHTARAEAPHAQLVYNDYMSWEPGMEAHCAGVLRLLEGMKKRGTPIDALGVQSHIITQGADAHGGVLAMQDRWRHFLDAVTGMGLTLLITEFDVRDNHLPAAIGPRDQAVADYSRAYLDVMFAYPQLRDVLVWGMCDRYSWIESFEPRADGAHRRPCPYDDRFAAKPMRAAIAAALAQAPPR
jgi:endo-1,4-beta-xylanase